MKPLCSFSLSLFLLLPVGVFAQEEAPSSPAVEAVSEPAADATDEAAVDVAEPALTNNKLGGLAATPAGEKVSVETVEAAVVEAPTDAESALLAGLASAPAPVVAEASEAPERAPASHFSPFVDTRLTFVLADDNMLAGPGESNEPSPGLQLGADQSNNLFFESYDTKDSGFENLTHLVLFKEGPTFFKGLTGAAALVLRVDVDTKDAKGSTMRLADSSSYIQLRYRPEGWGEKESISFTGFPVSSDRFRLGYSYRLTWGGARTFLQSTKVPGARLQLTRDKFYLWAGAKTAVLDQQVALQAEQATEKVTNLGALFGGGVDVTENLRLEANGGYFSRGTFAREAVRGEKAWAAGGSFQAAWHQGRDVGTSIDLRLYRNDPTEHQEFFHAPKLSNTIDWVIKSEFSYLLQSVEDPEAYGSVVGQVARAGDINFAMRAGHHRFFADAEFRDLSFILFNVPSLVPFVGYTNEMIVKPEWFVSVGYDHYFESIHLSPGVRFGVQNPANVVVEAVAAGPNPPVNLTGRRTLVVRREGRFDVLPTDVSTTPIIALQGTLKLDISESLSAIGELSFEVDNNRATFRRDTHGETVAVFVDPYLLSFNMVLQARF